MGREYARFLCRHWSSRLPTSRRLPTGTYAHSCARCTRTYCQIRAGDIKLRNSAEKRRLKAIVTEKRTLLRYTNFLNDPSFQDDWHESTEASERLTAIRNEEPEQIRAAWAFYYTLFPGGE